MPESLRSARLWDQTRDHYARHGLCDRCAAQAAYGHADGFVEVHRPCTGCAELVADLPVEQVNGWRSFHRGQEGGRTPALRPQEPISLRLGNLRAA